MQNQHKNIWRQRLAALLFLALLCGLGATNAPLLYGQIKDLRAQGFAAWTDGFEKALSENLRQKNAFINLNGAMNRALDVHYVNHVQKFKNGSLSDESHFIEEQPLAEKVEALHAALSRQGIGFLYVRVPEKANFYEVPFAPGFASDGRASYEEMTQLLAETDVPNIDMDAWFAENGWDMLDTYFRTDHHWRPEAAFAAVRETMKNLASRGLATYRPASLDAANWNKKVYKNFALGSWGKRTGQFYERADDFSYIYPQFPMHTTVDELLNMDGDPHVTFYDSPYDKDLLAKKDYFDSVTYYSYMHKDFGLARLHNDAAVNKKKVLLFGDSFKMPFSVFLSTQFSDIDYIDMRYYQDGGFLAYVAQTKPDLVILVANGPNEPEAKQYRFGVAQWQQAYGGKVANPVAMRADAKIPAPYTKSEGMVRGRMVASFHEENKDMPYAAVQPGTVLREHLSAGGYRLTVGQVSLAAVARGAEGEEADSKPPYVELAVWNKTTNEMVARRFLDARETSPQTWYFTAPAGGDYQIVAYPGTDETAFGRDAALHDMHLDLFVHTGEET